MKVCCGNSGSLLTTGICCSSHFSESCLRPLLSIQFALTSRVSVLHFPGAADNLVNKVIELKNIAIGSKIALRNIFFDTGKSTLRPESNAELDRLMKLMKDVPGLKIEISGHTDNTGSASLNETLSQSRAEAVVSYLTSKGISGSRMTAKGYGSSKPIATNATDDGRQQNRRTEFEIKGN